MTPHFGMGIVDRGGEKLEPFSYPERKGVVSKETSATMRTILESVVAEGSGKNAYIEGYRIGGRQQPRRHFREASNKYISSLSDLLRQTIHKY